MYARVALTLLYAIALGAVTALDDLDGLPGIVPFAAFMLAVLIGFLVGRWWAVFAALGTIAGQPIGWDSSEHDGNSALWLPYVISFVFFYGVPLLVGAAIAAARERRRHGQAV